MRRRWRPSAPSRCTMAPWTTPTASCPTHRTCPRWPRTACEPWEPTGESAMNRCSTPPRRLRLLVLALPLRQNRSAAASDSTMSARSQAWPGLPRPPPPCPRAWLPWTLAFTAPAGVADTSAHASSDGCISCRAPPCTLWVEKPSLPRSCDTQRCPPLCANSCSPHSTRMKPSHSKRAKRPLPQQQPPQQRMVLRPALLQLRPLILSSSPCLSILLMTRASNLRCAGLLSRLPPSAATD